MTESKNIQAPSGLEEIIIPANERKAKNILRNLLGREVVVVYPACTESCGVSDYHKEDGICLDDNDYVGFDQKSPTNLRHTVCTEPDNVMGGPGFYVDVKGVRPVRLYQRK